MSAAHGGLPLSVCWWLLAALPASQSAPASGERAALGQYLETLETWDLAAAEKQLAALAASGGDPELLREFRGRLAFFRGDYAAASATLAGSESPYAALAAATLAETETYDLRESPHFALRFPRGKDELLAPYALETLELARTRIGADLGVLPEEKIRVEILRDPTALSRLSPLTAAEIETSGTIALCKYAKLMVVSPRALVTGYAWQDTLAHELTHYLITRASQNHTPIWLHEGIAKYEESRWRGAAGQALAPSTAALLGERLAAGSLIPFEKMHPSIAKLPSQKDAALAFAEVFTTIEFLVKQRHASLSELLSELRSGDGDTAAVEAVAHEPFVQVERDWRAYLKERPPAPGTAGTAPPEPAKLRFKKQLNDPRPSEVEVDGAELDTLGDPADARRAHLGALLLARDRPAAAIVELGKAEQHLGPRSPTLSNLYARALLRAGQGGRARQVLEASLIPYPEIAQTRVKLGAIALADQRWGDAKEALLAANAIDPFDPEIHAGLAAVARAQSDAALDARERRALQLLGGN